MIRSRIALYLGGALLAAMLTACGGNDENGGAADDADVGPAPFELTVQPTDHAVDRAEEASFGVESSEAATYQWQQETSSGWADIVGATSQRFVNDPPRAIADGARLRVVVVQRASPSVWLTSSVVQMKVAKKPEPPRVTTQPANLKLYVGMRGSLSVTASGTSLRYQWERSRDGRTWSKVPSGTAATLAVHARALGDHGTRFRVHVSNKLGSVVSRVASLSVGAAPTGPSFISSPAPVSITLGERAIFTARVSGRPAPTLVWQFASPRSATWSDLKPHATPTLVLRPTQLNLSGTRYRLVATNSVGRTVSAPATLTIRPNKTPPTITRQPADRAIAIGSDVLFQVAATGTPSPRYQWQISVDGGASFANINGATARALVLPEVSIANDATRIRVVVANAAGSRISRTALLRVMAAPVIVSDARAQWWDPGATTAAFRVVAEGRNLRYRWQTSSDGVSFKYVDAASSDTYVHTGSADDKTAFVRAVVDNDVGRVVGNGAPLNRIPLAVVFPATTGDHLVSLAAADAAGNVIVASTARGTMLRSLDGGTTWARTAEYRSTGGTYRSPHSPRAAIAFWPGGTGVAVGQAGLIRRSTDAGRSWITIQAPGEPSSNPSGKSIGSLDAAAFADERRVVAVGTAGMLYSVDAGVTWQPCVVEGGASAIDVQFDASGRVGLAVGHGVILRSVDAGVHWSKVASPVYPNLNRVRFVDARVAIAVGNDSLMLRSDDAGLSWSAVYPGMTGDITGLAFKDSRVGLAQSSRGALSRTHDGGATWSSLESSFLLPAAIIATSKGAFISGSHFGFARRSVDEGATWDVVLSGVWLRDTTVAFLDRSTAIATGWFRESLGCRDIWYPNCQPEYRYTTVLSRSEDGGSTWSTTDVRIPGRVNEIVFADRNVGIALRTGENPVRTVDGGRTWETVGSLPSFLPASNLAFASPKVGVLSLPSNGLARTTDAGATWRSVDRTQSQDFWSVRFANARIGAALTSGTVWRTIDGGTTWTASPEPPPGGVSSLSFGSADGLFALTADGHVLKSADAGVRWTLLSQIERPTYLYSWDWAQGVFKGLLFITPTHGYAYTERWLFETLNGGLTWQLVVEFTGDGQGFTELRAREDGAVYLPVEGSIYRLTR